VWHIRRRMDRAPIDFTPDFEHSTFSVYVYAVLTILAPLGDNSVEDYAGRIRCNLSGLDNRTLVRVCPQGSNPASGVDPFFDLPESHARLNHRGQRGPAINEQSERWGIGIQIRLADFQFLPRFLGYCEELVRPGWIRRFETFPRTSLDQTYCFESTRGHTRNQLPNEPYWVPRTELWG